MFPTPLPQLTPAQDTIRLYKTTDGKEYITDEKHNIFYPLESIYSNNSLPPKHLLELPYAFEHFRSNLLRLTPKQEPNRRLHLLDSYFNIDCSDDLYPLDTCIFLSRTNPDNTCNFYESEEQEYEDIGAGIICDHAQLQGEQKSQFIERLEQEWGVFEPKPNTPQHEKYQQQIEQLKIKNMDYYQKEYLKRYSGQWFQLAEHRLRKLKIIDPDKIFDELATALYLDCQQRHSKFPLFELYANMFRN